MPSENGWEPAHAKADQCEWVKIPGAEHVSLQLLKGIPLTIMRAYAADYHAYVEPLRDADSAAWTPTNSVATSNHLNGTAMDLNWDTHPFRVDYAGYTPQMIATMRDMLTFYEGTMFWAQDWTTPKDAMHHQVGYDTYQDQARCRDFVARKIRPDGFSTFRRGGQPFVPLTRAERYALAIIAEGRRLGITPRGIKIALAVALVESNLIMYANAKDPASMALPHDAVGFDYDSSGIFQQRPSWGPITDRMDVTRSTMIFFTVDHGYGVRGLTKIRTPQGIPLDYRDESRSPGFYAQTVQGSAFPDRYDKRWADAERLYDKLAGIPTTPTEPADPVMELLMSNVQVESLSIYATPGEAKVPLLERIKLIDAMLHRFLVDFDAKLADTDALSRLLRTADGRGKFTDMAAIGHARSILVDRAQYPGVVRFLAMQAASGHGTARNILAEIEATNRPALQAFIDAQKGA